MKIELANKSDLTNILLIADTAFGKNFITKQKLETYINQPNQYLFVGIIDDDIAGFITTEVCNKTELQNNLLQPIDLPQYTTNIGWIKQVAVTPNHYRKGIANELLKATTIALKPFCDTLFCISWVKGAITPMSKLLIKNKFTLLQNVTNYWSNDSLAKQYNCNVCGKPPCKCSAELFIKP